MQPGFSGFAHLSDTEIEASVNELTKKYFIANRLGNNELLSQLNVYVNMYKEEMSKRFLLKLKHQDGDLEQLINVD